MDHHPSCPARNGRGACIGCPPNPPKKTPPKPKVTPRPKTPAPKAPKRRG